MGDETSQVQQQRPERKEGMGCFLFGCLTLTIICLVGAVGIFFAVRSFVGSYVEEYTEDAPRVLPQASLSDDQLRAAKQKFESFRSALTSGQSGSRLELTAAEINALLAASPEFKEFRENLVISIEGNRLRGDLSLPLAQFGYSGKYLNGQAEFLVRHQNGRLVVMLDTLTVRGKPAPEEIMAELRTENLAEELGDVPEYAVVLDRLKNVEIKDNTLILETGAAAVGHFEVDGADDDDASVSSDDQASFP